MVANIGCEAIEGTERGRLQVQFFFLLEFKRVSWFLYQN